DDFNDELNVFLRSHKIVEIEKQLVQSASGAYWCIYITYLEPTIAEKAPKEKIDYMKELAPETFARFSQLRKIRKEIAGKENVSAFVIFTDAELAEMAKMPELSVGRLKDIKGIGKAKAEKYGKLLIDTYNEPEHETSGQPDATNSES
ncbi:MAG: HRDC domain-containing protein, partial [Saprospiraceae bacterium]